MSGRSRWIISSNFNAANARMMQVMMIESNAPTFDLKAVYPLLNVNWTGSENWSSSLNALHTLLRLLVDI